MSHPVSSSTSNNTVYEINKKREGIVLVASLMMNPTESGTYDNRNIGTVSQMFRKTIHSKQPMAFNLKIHST